MLRVRSLVPNPGLVLIPIQLALAVGLLAGRLPAQDFSQPDTAPAPGSALIEKANNALSAGKYHEALDVLTALNAQTPNNPQVLYDLGLTLEALEAAQQAPSSSSSQTQPLTAESCYRKAIDANPLFAPPHVALGLLLARSNRPAEARRELATAAGLPDLAPSLKASALRALARIDQQANPPNPAASSELLEALGLSPEQPADILLSAQIADSTGNFLDAERAYRRYLALPGLGGDTQATAALAHTLLAQHRAAEAEVLLEKSLEQHPGDPTFTSQLAQSYLASSDPGKVALAVPLLEQLHASHAEDPNIARLLARVYVETGHPDQADPLYASLISASSAHPDPTLLDARADALIRLHRPAEAEKLLKQALADPSAFPSPAALGDAATHLAFAASEIDDPRTTLQALTVRATVQQPSPSSLFLEATANDSLHQSSKAAELYKRFLSVASGKYPEQELQARHRLAELAHMK